MDNLQGRNDELRLALRETRHESNKSALEYEKAMEKVTALDFINLYYAPVNEASAGYTGVTHSVCLSVTWLVCVTKFVQ